jgi:hypothetical protein
MAWLGMVAATLLIVAVLVDTFEVMIFPRRVAHPLRLARLVYRVLWFFWSRLAHLLKPGKWRNGFLSIFGPMSLFGLLTVWALGLITGFALLLWCSDSPISPTDTSFGSHLYLSGVTFFTLGYGDILPIGTFGRFLCVIEAGLGFGFLAVVISYLPVLYQAFSRREIVISLLDARAGSPPTAGELLRRLAAGKGHASLAPMLQEWERWSAEILESHLSFPVLRYYRSQHDNQSWIGALTTILDTCAVLIAAGDGPEDYQARLTFAMARHAAVDLSMASRTTQRPDHPDRLAARDFENLRKSLIEAGLPMRTEAGAAQALLELRALYEPFVVALAEYFVVALPGFEPSASPVDNWQKSAWMEKSPGLSGLPAAGITDEHFD